MLPPVSTKEFTVADIGLLSKRVHEQMVAALCEISPHATVKAASRHETPKPAPQEAAAPVPAPSLPLDAKTNSSTNSSRASSSERRKMSSSEAGTETEEDEGMILVGRPT